jgi:hypothetical protein
MMAVALVGMELQPGGGAGGGWNQQSELKRTVNSGSLQGQPTQIMI